MVKADDELHVTRILKSIASICLTRRASNLESFFKDKDERHNGCVNARIFRTVIGEIVPVIRLSEDEWALLQTKYQRGELGTSFVSLFVCFIHFSSF